MSIGLGVVPNFLLYLIIMVMFGIAISFWNSMYMVLLQTTVDSEFMGRVMSAFTMISSTMMPLGMVVFGPAADIISIDILLVGSGIVIALLCIPMAISKTLRNAGRKHLQNNPS
jgi:DHA3 family macrolide efflux protein-like MFS transporter